MARRAEITAVPQEELRALMDHLGVLADFEAGELRCSICEEPLQERAVGAVRLGTDGPLFACGKLKCLDDFHD